MEASCRARARLLIAMIILQFAIRKLFNIHLTTGHGAVIALHFKLDSDSLKTLLLLRCSFARAILNLKFANL